MVHNTASNRVHVANYKEEQGILIDVIGSPNPEKKIIVLSGKSGIGKTRVIEACEARMASALYWIELDVSNIIHPLTFVRTICRRVKNKRETAFSRTLDELFDKSDQLHNISISNINQDGSGNNLDLKVYTSESQQRIFMRFLEELDSLDQDVVLIMDKFHDVKTEMLSWVREYLLPEIYNTSRLRIIFITHDFVENDWRPYKKHLLAKELKGVKDVDAWLDYAKSLNKCYRHSDYPNADLKMYITFLVDNVDGDPLRIEQKILALPNGNPTDVQ